jgi:mevalonate kinase
MGISHRLLQDICDIIKDHGLSTKFTGADGGGCAVTLIPGDPSRPILSSIYPIDGISIKL